MKRLRVQTGTVHASCTSSPDLHGRKWDEAIARSARATAISTLAFASLLALGVGPAARAAENVTNAAPTTPSAESTSPPAASTTTTAHTGTDLDAFRIIFERNIFNPNRSGRRNERDFSFRDNERERRVRTESIALLGTMSYDRGRFAFFDGSSSDYRKTVKASDTIAGFTVASVSPQQVVLRSPAASVVATNDPASTNSNSTSTNSIAVTNTNETSITLPVGMQLQRRDDGPWEVSARTDSGGSRSGTSSSITGSMSAGGGGSEDVLKRLMQQREQEAGGAPSPAAETHPTTPPPAAPTPSTSGGEDDILKRLMQRREQENK